MKYILVAIYFVTFRVIAHMPTKHRLRDAGKKAVRDYLCSTRFVIVLQNAQALQLQFAKNIPNFVF